jgi:hypothetical protein
MARRVEIKAPIVLLTTWRAGAPIMKLHGESRVNLIGPYRKHGKRERISQRWGMDVNFPKYDELRLA